jgi:hypothetical protein
LDAHFPATRRTGPARHSPYCTVVGDPQSSSANLFAYALGSQIDIASMFAALLPIEKF